MCCCSPTFPLLCFTQLLRGEGCGQHSVPRHPIVPEVGKSLWVPFTHPVHPRLPGRRASALCTLLQVKCVLEDESSRGQAYLPQPTLTAVLNTCRTVFLTAHYNGIITK